MFLRMEPYVKSLNTQRKEENNMLLTYEAPNLTLYGSVSTLTSSFKCTPGKDTDFDASDTGDKAVFINLETGMDCVNEPFPTGESK